MMLGVEAMWIGLRLMVTILVAALAGFGLAAPVFIDARHCWPRQLARKRE
jgi:hypothetical protein